MRGRMLLPTAVLLCALTACPVMDGAVTIDVSTTDSVFGIDANAFSQEYGYFKGEMGFSNENYWNWVDARFQNLGTKRIAYWSYRLLATHTDALVATQVGEMDFTDGDLYGYEYRWRDDGRAIYILWHETGSETVTLSVNTPRIHVMNLIPDRFGNTQEYVEVARDGKVTVTVGQDPLLVEEETDAPASRCVRDANANGIGDIVDVQTTAADLSCHVYLPLVVRNWRQPWSTVTPTATATPTPTPTPTPGKRNCWTT